MRPFVRLALIAVVFVVGASKLRAQDSGPATGSAGPCRDYPCKVLVDWGAGNTGPCEHVRRPGRRGGIESDADLHTGFTIPMPRASYLRHRMTPRGPRGRS